MALCVPFIKGKSKVEFPALKDLTFAKLELKRRKKKFGGDWPEIDMQYALHAVFWINDLGKALSKEERAEWIFVWKQMLQASLRSLRPRGDREELRLLYGYENSLLRKVSVLLPQLRVEEGPEEFWNPILSLGWPGHYYIDFFLSYWFSSNLNDPSEGFVREWKAMLDFAFTSSVWSTASIRKSYRARELWGVLMGLKAGKLQLEQGKTRAVIQELDPYYKKWIERHIGFSTCATALVNFLAENPQCDFLFDALIALEKEYIPLDKNQWDEREFRPILAYLLEEVFEHRYEELRSRQDALKSFQSLLRRLVELQETHAIALSSRIGT